MTCRLTLQSDTADHTAARIWAQNACRALVPDASNDELLAVVLALHEIVRNATEHAYASAPPGEIEILAETTGDGVALSVRHSGAPCDPQSAREPVFDGSEERGFGLFLAGHAVDRMEFSTEPDGRHCVRLEKRLCAAVELRKGGAEMLKEIKVLEVPLETLDHTTAREFKRLIEQVAQPGMRLVLDLRRVSFMDSSGLGALLSAMRTVARANGDLKVCSLSPAVRVLFELVRVHRVFDIVETPEDAISAFAG